MSTPLPVPSKVAVTAIRGLIVGTTCSLALITEDRRRRIKNAHNAIQNAEKIRSARNYHAGGAALALAIEEDAALFEPTNVRRSSSVDRWDKIRARLAAKEEESLRAEKPAPTQPLPETTAIQRREQDSSVLRKEEETSENNSTPAIIPRGRVKLKPPMLAPAKGLPIERRGTSVLQAAGQKLISTTTSARSPFAFPTENEIRTMAEQAESNRDRQLLDQALSLMVQLLTVRPKGPPLDESTLKTCALLCCTCQDMGNFDGARQIFRLARDFGPLAETAFYSFDPLKLLEEIILRLKPNFEAGKLRYNSLVYAIDLYCTKFIEEPQIKSERGFTIGIRLMEMAFAKKALKQIESLYWRCNHHRQNDLPFTQWFILQLYGAGEYKAAINFFNLSYAKQAPDHASVEEVGEAMVDSVLKLQGYKAATVLQALDQICSQDSHDTGELHTTWVMKLLEAHWECQRDIDKTATVFAALNRPLNRVVNHPEGVWRVMMELAYKAGRPEMAESLLEEAMDAGDIEGRFTAAMHYARAKGEKGDWEGVIEEVKSLKLYKNGVLADRVSRRLIPLFQLYAANHTIGETDAYIRRFVTDLQIPIIRELVTFNATQYGTVRDGDSLLAWLEYCAAQGFKVDAAFSNTILSTCRHTWKLAYRDLRKLYLKLRDLGDGFTDEYTERLMADAALSQRQTRQEWRAHIKNCDQASAVPMRRSMRAGKNYSPQDIILMMKEEIVLQRPTNAVKIYSQADRAGVQLPIKALYLAVKAALASGDDGMETALDVMRKAEARGMDVTPCTARIILARFQRIDPKLNKLAQLRAVQKILDDAKREGMLINDAVINQAAFLCLRAGGPRQAMNLACRAAEIHKDASAICFNVLNFSVLLQGSIWMGNLEMMMRVIAKAKTMPYWTDEANLKALKQSLKAARDSRHKFPQTFDTLTEAVQHCIKSREELKEEGFELQEGALAIMRAAAKSQQEDGGAFHEVIEKERQELQRLREVEAVLLNARHEQQRSRGAEGISPTARREAQGEYGSIPSRKRRGMLWKEENELIPEEQGLVSPGENTVSEPAAEEAARPPSRAETAGPDPFEQVFLQNRR